MKRLTIKTAIRMARVRVRTVLVARDQWAVRIYWPHPQTLFVNSREELRLKRRENYIFVALMLLGVESNEALPAAMRAADSDKSWRDEVASIIERRALTRTARQQ